MINFIKLSDYILINVNEIMYTDFNLDENCEYESLNIIMKDGKHFIIDKEYIDTVWSKLTNWIGVDNDN